MSKDASRCYRLVLELGAIMSVNGIKLPVARRRSIRLAFQPSFPS